MRFFLIPTLRRECHAGYSGSAYTAHISTMRVTDELDALRMMGILLSDLLVLPFQISIIWWALGKRLYLPQLLR